MIEFLNMIETFDVQPLHSWQQVNLFAEIAKRVFADRAEYLGDPSFHDVPTTALINPAYARRRAAAIDPSRRSDPASIAAVDLEQERFGTETTHFSIVDRNGMTVANTTTLNTAFGSGAVVDGAGFLLNSQMNDFSAKPGAPNHYGVTGSTANQIAAGKRPLSSMTPTLVFDSEGKLMLALGSPGGATIVSSVTQVIVHVIDYGMALKQAVDAPRFHHQWPPFPPREDPLTVEEQPEYAMPPALLDALIQRGYAIRPAATIGDVQAVSVEGRTATGVFDRRRTGGVAYE
jgi:gamma-glutamyltranspeptidase/glutathione hydrolase